MTLLVLLPLLFAVGEFFRLSLSDQGLARATHLGAQAAGSNPADCDEAVRNAFRDDSMARWLFDRDGDGQIGFVTGSGPDGSPGSEVRIDIAADDGDVSNGVEFNVPSCGAGGSWIEVRAVVPIRAGFAFRDVRREHVSWAMNQR